MKLDVDCISKGRRIFVYAKIRSLDGRGGIGTATVFHGDHIENNLPPNAPLSNTVQAQIAINGNGLIFIKTVLSDENAIRG